jgi:hypothetical protein
VVGNAITLSSPAAITLPVTGHYSVLLIGTDASVTTPYQFTLASPPVNKTVVTPGNGSQILKGTLAFPGQVDKYTFTGTAGQQLYFNGLTDTDTGGSIGAALVGPTGQGVPNGGPPNTADTAADMGPMTLNQAGTYTLTVFASAQSTGTYSFCLLDAGTVKVITLPSDSASGTLTPGQNSTDLYQFTGTQGQQLTLHLDPPTSTADDITLFGPNNYYLETLSPGVTNTVTLPESGHYVVAVHGFGTTAISYNFEVSAAGTTAAVSGFSPVHQGTLAGGASTSFTYSAPAGRAVLFHYPQANGNIHVTLTGPTGQQVYADNQGFDSPVLFLPLSGTYTLTVNDPSGASQSYDVQLIDLAGYAKPLTLGNNSVGNTVSPGSLDVWSFTGSVGQHLYYDGISDSSGAMQGRVIGPGGELASRFVFATAADSLMTLPESGPYYLLQYAPANATATYSFRLLNEASAPALKLNTPITATLTPGSSASLYQFTGSAGEYLFFNGLSGSSTTTSQLYGPDNGNAGLFTTLNGGPPVSTILPFSGTYTLAISDIHGSSSSPESYSFELLTPKINKTPYTLGTTVNGNIAGVGQIDEYTFTGKTGQQLFFNGLTGSAPLFVALTNPTGQGAGVYSHYVGSTEQGVFTLAEPGTYTLTVSGGNTATTGSYGFRLLDAAGGTSILNGEVFTVSLSQPSTGVGSVNYATQDGSAVAGTDYVAASGTLIFNPGDTSQTFKVYTLPDASLGPSAAFFVNLSNASGATIKTGQGTGIILNATPMPATLVFLQQPRSTPAGQVISPAVKVEVLDQFGHLFTAGTEAITLALGNNPGGRTLSGTLTQQTANGVATFSDLSINKPGNGYTLLGSTGNLKKVTSAAFNIT